MAYGIVAYVIGILQMECIASFASQQIIIIIIL